MDGLPAKELERVKEWKSEAQRASSAKKSPALRRNPATPQPSKWAGNVHSRCSRRKIARLSALAWPPISDNWRRRVDVRKISATRATAEKRIFLLPFNQSCGIQRIDPWTSD